MSEISLATELTPLQQRVARKVVDLVRREGRVSGERLPEIQLAERIGTSRSPVQAALRHLAQRGVVQQDARRGYFLLRDAKDWSDVAAELSSSPDDPLYMAIAEARRAGELPDHVSESELLRRFNAVRATMRKVLARISEEGWVEQNVSNGWTFLPIIDTPEAYEESYLFRLTLEPSGILGPSFRVDSGELEELKAEQQRIVNGGYRNMTPIEIFESNSRFHETLARWSNNRFIEQAIRRVNLQRRLVEYGQSSHSSLRGDQAKEHLEILEAIKRQDFLQAATLLRTHLDGARNAKVRRKS